MEHKKSQILSAALIGVILLSGSSIIQAASGAVAGQYYSTDIVTTLNGMEIDAINIGGQTLISAEDMHYYSFSVRWDGETRTLCVDSVAQAQNGTPPAVKKSDVPSGSVLGSYYDTDIVTYLDGMPITAYNTGGRTYIHAEEMRKFGYRVLWDGETRRLSVTSPDRAGYIYDIPLSDGKEHTEEGTGAFSVAYTKQGITGAGDADYMDMTFFSGKQGYSFYLAFYQYESLFSSEKLFETLNQMTSSDPFTGESSPPEEKYDVIHQNLKVSINGQKAEHIIVTKGGGNGHRDYIISVQGVPRYTKDEIEEITIVLGKPQSEHGVGIMTLNPQSLALQGIAGFGFLKSTRKVHGRNSI